MNKPLNIILGSALFVATASTHAACGTSACTGKITTLYMPNTDHIYIGTEFDETTLNCTPVSQTLLTLRRSHKNFDEIYASLLVAHHSNTNMRIKVSTGTNGCAVSYVVAEN